MKMKKMLLGLAACAAFLPAPGFAQQAPGAPEAAQTPAAQAGTTTAPAARTTESTTLNPQERALGAGLPPPASTRSRNSAILVLAVAVAATAWSVVGLAGWQRFRGDEGW